MISYSVHLLEKRRGVGVGKMAEFSRPFWSSRIG